MKLVVKVENIGIKLNLKNQYEVIEYLKYMGYKNPRYIGFDEYAVDTIGKQVPAIIQIR